MNDDTASVASAESAADKAPAIKKRSTKAELAQERVVELAELKATALTLLSASTRTTAVAKMAKLEAQIKLDELSQAMARSKSSRTGFDSFNSLRLIYARTALDYEFQQHVNSGVGKWSMITEKYNKRFTYLILIYQKISLWMHLKTLFLNH
jgi:hypothetical protein